MTPADPPTGSPAAPLDEATLNKLRELDPTGKNGVVARVLAAYEGSLDKFLAQLLAQAAAPDGAVLAAIAHTLKSSSASVGALQLSRNCEALERSIRSGTAAQTHDVEQLIAQVRAAQGAVRHILRG